MEFKDVIEKRRSIRKYKKTPIPRESITKILEAARKAPSAFHSQPWHFIVVEDEERKRRVADPQFWAAEAPVMIVAIGLETPEADDVYYPRYIDSIKEYHMNRLYMLDIGIAFEHVILAATDLGLASCWMSYGWGRNAEIKEVLDIPDKYRVIARTPIGYPDEEPRPKERRNLESIMSIGKFGNNQAQIE